MIQINKLTKDMNESVMDRRLAHLNEAVRLEVLAILNDASIRMNCEIKDIEFRVGLGGEIHVRKRK